MSQFHEYKSRARSWSPRVKRKYVLRRPGESQELVDAGATVGVASVAEAGV